MEGESRSNRLALGRHGVVRLAHHGVVVRLVGGTEEGVLRVVVGAVQTTVWARAVFHHQEWA